MADELAQLHEQGWRSVTHLSLRHREILPFRDGPSSAVRWRKITNADVFLHVLGEETMACIASAMELARQQATSPNKHLRKQVTAQEVRSMLAVHIHRMLKSSLRTDAFYDEYNKENDRRLPLGINRYTALLGLLGMLRPAQLTLIRERICQGFRSSWQLGPYRTIDELVYEWARGDLTVYMERKPHPNGHLFYMLCTKLDRDSDHPHPLPYCFDFLPYIQPPQMSPTDAARELMARNSPPRNQLQPVWVVDSAFATTDFFSLMQAHGRLFIASTQLSALGSLQQFIGHLGSNQFRLFQNKFGVICMAYHGEKTDDKGNTCTRLMTSLSNLYVTGDVVCSCDRPFTREFAEFLLRAPMQDIKALCALKQVKGMLPVTAAEMLANGHSSSQSLTFF